MRNFIFALLLVEALFSLAFVAPASARTDLSREQIKSMDILERPYRAGHFYGNTVRRRHTRAHN